MPRPQGSVVSGAAYANRNPLFRSPGRQDGVDTDDSNGPSNTSAIRAPSHSQPSHGSRGRGRGNRHASDISPRLENKDVHIPMDRSLNASGTRSDRRRSGSGGSRGGSRHALLESPSRVESDTPSVSGMVMLSDMKRGGVGGGSSGRGIGSSNHGGHRRSNSAAAFGSMGGKEPAVKGSGCMKSATFFKLVGHLLHSMPCNYVICSTQVAKSTIVGCWYRNERCLRYLGRICVTVWWLLVF